MSGRIIDERNLPPSGRIPEPEDIIASIYVRAGKVGPQVFPTFLRLRFPFDTDLIPIFCSLLSNIHRALALHLLIVLHYTAGPTRDVRTTTHAPSPDTRRGHHLALRDRCVRSERDGKGRQA
jgi:hypothetical protein